MFIHHVWYSDKHIKALTACSISTIVQQGMKYNVNFFGTQQVIRLGPVTEVWKVLLYTMGSLKNAV